MRSVHLQYYEIIQLPLYLSTSASLLWPPDGIIMAALVLFFILGFHFIILIFGVSYALFSRLKKISYYNSSLFKIIYHVSYSLVTTFSRLGVKYKLIKLVLVLVGFRVQWTDSTLSTT